MHVQRLRTKLGRAGDMIETVRGVGYRFNDEALAGA
jgi:two-component system phosphate regulon response regulator PhoB